MGYRTRPAPSSQSAVIAATVVWRSHAAAQVMRLRQGAGSSYDPPFASGGGVQTFEILHR